MTEGEGDDEIITTYTCFYTRPDPCYITTL